MADFTETPYAEDFHMELSDLLDTYLGYGMTTKTAILCFKMILEDLELDELDEDE